MIGINYFKFGKSGFFILLLYSINSCNKNSDSVRCPCSDFPKSNNGGINSVHLTGTQRKAPFFNPNNNSEFVYLFENEGEMELRRYNLDLKEDKVLLSGLDIIGQPKWGQNDKIVFTSADYQLNIVDSDGRGHVKITHSNYYLYPEWLSNGTLLCEFSYNLGILRYICNIDTNGTILDTLANSSFILGATNRINEIATIEYRDDPNILIRNKYGTVKIQNYSFNGRNRVTGICWHSNCQDIYFTTYREGLFILNRNSKYPIRIKMGCDSKSYRSISLSENSHLALVEIVFASDFDNGSWSEESKIALLDLQNKSEIMVF